MNVAYYVMAFDHATDGLFDLLGIGAEYCRRENRSVFAVEQHIAYKRELTRGERLVVSSQLLGFDDKRLHFFQRMAAEGGGHLAATDGEPGTACRHGGAARGAVPGGGADAIGAADATARRYRPAGGCRPRHRDDTAIRG